MTSRVRFCRLALAASMLLSSGAWAQGTASPPAPKEIRALRYPALSPNGDRIAFSYQGDLWLVPAAGGEAKRLAAMPGYDARPRWSPDGTTLAFVSTRHGNYDIFTVPVAGGEPKRITFNSADDLLADWSPDGKELLFYASRDSRNALLYTVNLTDGRVRELTRDEVTLQTPSFSPDGKTVAYVRGTGAWARRGYRGSANSDVYLLPLGQKGAVPKRVTTFEGNDLWPVFTKDAKSLLYVADMKGLPNLWSVPIAGGKPRQVTFHTEDGIHYPAVSLDRRTMVYDLDFSLWTLDLAQPTAKPKRLTITAAIEPEKTTEERVVNGGLTEMEISPDGKWIAFGAKNDIFVVSSDKTGEPKRLTTSLARDYDFGWSPDSKSLAFVSERDANSDIWVVDVDTGLERRLTSNITPERSPHWSPDGQWIAYLKGANGNALCAMRPTGGIEQTIAAERNISEHEWSPDGKWLAYSRRGPANNRDVWVAPFPTGKPINVSRFAGMNVSPEWLPDGKTLAFFSDRSGQIEIYTVNLAKPGAAAGAGMGGAPAATEPLVVAVEGLQKRVRRLALQPPMASKVQLFVRGDRLFYLANGELWSSKIDGSDAKKVLSSANGDARLTQDASTFYMLSGGAIRRVPTAGGAPETLAVDVKYPVDLIEERRQVFDEAWRLLSDNFYDPRMHGLDWAQVRRRYRPMVDHTTVREDFYMLLTQMVGELNASHLGISGPTSSAGGGPSASTASLGVWLDYDHAGPGIKVREILTDGPADRDESRIKPGEYILAIGGKDVVANEALFEALNGKAGGELELVVSSTPDRAAARTVKIRPINGNTFSNLLYEHQVYQARKRVNELSHGRLAYMHIKAMDQPSLRRFEQELVSEAYEKDGLVLDVRWNPGGRIHDELFDILTRKVHVYETARDALRMTQPFGAFFRPVILLINQSSTSDAEIFPNGFRVNNLGKIVGVPTHGAVIGTNNRTLLDGQTTFRVPQTGWTTLDGRNLENNGVPPDITVEVTPQDVLEGRDPQLDTAVKELLKQLDTATKPARTPAPPAAGQKPAAKKPARMSSR